MDELKTPAAEWDEQEMIEPEGGLDISDLASAEDDFEDIDSNENTSSSTEAGPVGAEGTPAPTTESAPDAAEGKEAEPAPTTEPAGETEPNPLRFRAKIDHKETDVELNPGDLPELYQKGRNYDRMETRYKESQAQVQKMTELAAELGFDTIDAMIENARSTNRSKLVEELVGGGTAQEIAEFYVDQKLAGTRRKQPPATESDAKEQGQEHSSDERSPNTADYTAQVAALFAARPDLRGKLKELPVEVSKAVLDDNKPLLVAYTEWENKQMKAENERLAKERNLYASQVEAASRAPVRGVTSGGAPQQEKEDPWLIGFDDTDY